MQSVLYLFCTYVKKLCHIETQTFSGVSGVSFSNGVFNSTFDSYYVEARYTSTPGASTIRVRAGGADATGATDYKFVTQAAFAAGSRLDGGSTGASSVTIGQVNSGTRIFYFNLWLNSIALAQITTGVSLCSMNDGSNRQIRNSNFWHEVASVFDSLSLLSGGTISGDLRAYGYTKG